MKDRRLNWKPIEAPPMDQREGYDTDLLSNATIPGLLEASLLIFFQRVNLKHSFMNDSSTTDLMLFTRSPFFLRLS